DISFCIRDQHDFSLVSLAAGVCLSSTVTAVLSSRQSRVAKGRGARNWAVIGGAVTGFGIWSTHFIAMLGYDPGVVMGYKAGSTVGSLGIVVVSMAVAFSLAMRASTRTGRFGASVSAGAGFATMHYVGMAAVKMPAVIQWRLPYVALSLVLAIVPFFAGSDRAVRHGGRGQGFAAASMMTVAVVGSHFSGMAAIRSIPARSHTEAMSLSPSMMAVSVGSVSVSSSASCIGSWAITRRATAAIEVSERQFSISVKGISDCALYMLDLEGRVASWNAGAQRSKGYQASEVLGLPLGRFYSPEDRAAGAPQRASAQASAEGKFTGEGWRMRRDGSRFWAHVTIERIGLGRAGKADGRLWRA
ncbi:hypothetical protein OY671_007934, partial [Metschnikowia pulcherrima]